MSDRMPADEVALALGAIARRAGRAIVEMMRGDVAHRLKTDGSPSTDADLAAEAVIVAALEDRWPNVPVIAEESAETFGGRLGRRFFLVDPLDGTRDFIAGTGQFTVNIALIEDGAPVAGAIYAPVLRRLWIGGTTACAAEAAPDDAPVSSWQPLAVRTAPTEALVAFASLRHGDAETERFLAGLPLGERKGASSSLKFCLIAGGEADVYPRFGRTMQWDTAAGDAILRAAGGMVTNPAGAPVRYGAAAGDFANGPFIAWGDRSLVARFIGASRAEP